MMKLNSNQSLTFKAKFDLGNTNLTPDIRLVLEMNDQIKLFIPSEVNNGEAKITIPALKNFTEEFTNKSFKGHLEAVIGEEYFPLQDIEFELETPITMKVEKITEEKPKKKEKTIKLTSDIIIEDDELEKEIINEEKPKKKRGRPPKKKVEETTSSEDKFKNLLMG